MAAKKIPAKSRSKKPAPRAPTPRKPAAKAPARRPAPALATGAVLTELKSLAKELNKAAKGLGKKHNGSI